MTYRTTDDMSFYKERIASAIHYAVTTSLEVVGMLGAAVCKLHLIARFFYIETHTINTSDIDMCSNVKYREVL